MEDANGATRVNSNGACGGTASNCDLTVTSGADAGWPQKDTTAGQFRQGTASAQLDGSHSDGLHCANGTCTALTNRVNAATSWGCWTYLNDSTFYSPTLGSMELSNGSGGASLFGFMLQLGATTAQGQCYVGTSSTQNLQASDAGAGKTDLNTLIAYTCTYAGGASGAIHMYRQGKLDDNLGAVTTSMAAATQDFQVGASGGFLQAAIDDCYVYSGVLGPNSVTRITRCATDGTLCMCDGSNAANFKSCSVNADCRVVGNTTAICGAGGTCTGLDVGLCAGGSNGNKLCTQNSDCPSSTCTLGTMPACNAAPSTS
jgi:hypothetical protein